MRVLTYRNTLVAAVASLFLSLPLAAEVYQWRDENGKLHFSDKKPRGSDKRLHGEKVKDITRSVSQTNVDESQQEQEKLKRLFKPETAEEQSMRERQQHQEKNKAAEHRNRCAKARRELKVVQGRVVFVRPDGTEYSVSEKERQRRAQEMEALIQKYCA